MKVVSEAGFVLKCLVFTILLAFLLQLKIYGVSMETRADHFLRSSGVVSYMQDAADGGIAIARDGFYATKNFLLDSTASLRGESRSSR